MGRKQKLIYAVEAMGWYYFSDMISLFLYDNSGGLYFSMEILTCISRTFDYMWMVWFAGIKEQTWLSTKALAKYN